LGQKIDGIEVMIARVVLNECDLPDENADLTALVTFMAAKKFRWLFTQPSRHAGLGHALFIHDTAGHLRVFLDEYANSESPKNKFTTIRDAEKLAQAQISTLKHENAELQNKVESVLAKALAQETQIEKYASIENAEKLAQAQISTLKHENAELQNKVESVLAKALAQETLNDTEKRLHDKFTKIIANSTKQIESFIRIQSILGSEYMGDFHGWPISPDIGLFLLERMREQHYDLIIEFGSGTSTMMLARMSQVLAKKSTVMDKKRDSTHKTSNSKTTIVSFEHHEHYWKKTRQLLKAHRLGKLVELVHAPLQDWHDDTQAYRYYDCHKTLEALAQKNANRKLRILMLVDGPPGSTCVNARYPAVPIVFRALKGHYIDVILDDANRADEKRTIELWQQFWKRQSKHFVDQHIATEKGLYLASVS
jgi:serine protease inhibitor ecotin